MIKNPLVSVIIVNWNGGGVFEDCLKSLSRIGYQNIEIIVIDNNSSDGSINFASRYFSAVKVVKNKKVKGKKIGGVIVESKTKEHEVLGVVIGFGLNICQTVFQLNDATSLQLELNTPIDLKKIENEIIDEIIALF